MKSKTIMLISTLTLLLMTIVTVSLGWYISQEAVQARDATLQAEQSTSASINSLLIEDSHYGGQLGNKPLTHEDAPYVATAEVTLRAMQITQGTKLQIKLKKLIISKGTLADPTQFLLETNTPDNEMTYRVISGGVKYAPNSDGNLAREDNPNSLYQVLEGDNVFQLEIIFLNETSYKKWQLDNTVSLQEYVDSNSSLEYFDWLESNPQFFNYSPCGYSEAIYMYTNFYVTVEYTTTA